MTKSLSPSARPRAKPSPQTRNFVLTNEGPHHMEAAAVNAAMEELVSLVRGYCGGEVSWSMLDRDHPWAVME